jgi:hypothetical protein
MSKFSQRYGFKPAKPPFEIGELSETTRRLINNVLINLIYDRFSHYNNYNKSFFITLLHFELKGNLQKLLDDDKKNFHAFIITLINDLIWYSALDIIEFLIDYAKTNPIYDYLDRPIQEIYPSLTNGINSVFEMQNSAYRIVQDKIVEITSEAEIQGINELDTNLTSNGLDAPRTHLKLALELFAMRPDPDLRNCIKESISMVESVAKHILQDRSATLGKLLPKLKDKLGLHTAQVEGYSKLYGWTSDGDGIRHGMMDEPNLTIADARYMLVSCSAFSNYLLEKALKVGLLTK